MLLWPGDRHDYMLWHTKLASFFFILNPQSKLRHYDNVNYSDQIIGYQHPQEKWAGGRERREVEWLHKPHLCNMYVHYEIAFNDESICPGCRLCYPLNKQFQGLPTVQSRNTIADCFLSCCWVLLETYTCNVFVCW